MALALNAEQKSLLKIFKIEEQYIIPSYQRPYSWEYDQCFQLYNDLFTAFHSQEDYFIGNIIIAKAHNNRDYLEVVDGQQRLLTLLLLFRVLSLFQPEIKMLNLLLEKEDWKGENKILRIRSDVFEAEDGIALKDVLSLDFDGLNSLFNSSLDKHNKIVESRLLNKFEVNILHFFNWIKYYNDTNADLEEFTSYILNQVYLLPIELGGNTQDEANAKALTIFETINNRGMNLEDADIFKAKLYNKAKAVKEENSFIELWTDFKNGCDNLNLQIDDVFRYYSHIIRGKEGITSSETNLRNFFTTEKFSPFELKKYKEVLDDLFKIIEILELLNTEKIKTTEIAKWLQIIDAYTNQYPRYAIVNYLFVNDLKVDKYFNNLLVSLIKYVYHQGSTTTVKFEIYSIIKAISLGTQISKYNRPDITIEYFEYLGRLKKGYALLSFYLTQSVALPTYNIEKIINLKDESSLSDDWKEINLYDIIDRLGNYLILDIPKKNIAFNKKRDYYMSSNINEVQNLMIDNSFSFTQFTQRDLLLKERLVNFFKGGDDE